MINIEVSDNHNLYTT